MDLILNATVLYLATVGRELFPNDSEDERTVRAFKTRRILVDSMQSIYAALRDEEDGGERADAILSGAYVVYPDTDETKTDHYYLLVQDYAFEHYFGRVVGYSITPMSKGSLPVFHMENGDRITILTDEDIHFTG